MQVPPFQSKGMLPPYDVWLQQARRRNLMKGCLDGKPSLDWMAINEGVGGAGGNWAAKYCITKYVTRSKLTKLVLKRESNFACYNTTWNFSHSLFRSYGCLLCNY